jgi:hypothetical protein
MDYDTILTSVKKQIVVLEEAFGSVASRLLISFKNVLSTFLMRQFNVLQLLILQRLIPVWKNGCLMLMMIKRLKKVMYK